MDCFQFYISGQFSRPLTAEVVYCANFYLLELKAARESTEDTEGNKNIKGAVSVPLRRHTRLPFGYSQGFCWQSDPCRAQTNIIRSKWYLSLFWVAKVRFFFNLPKYFSYFVDFQPVLTCQLPLGSVRSVAYCTNHHWSAITCCSNSVVSVGVLDVHYTA